MKRKKLILPAITLFLVLVGIGIATIPAPPVNQRENLIDTQMPNVAVATCRGCHPGAPDIHHFMVSGTPKTNNVPTTTLGCNDCHKIVGGELSISRNCHDCHDGVAWTVNPLINLTVIRGAPGRPHHNATKNSASATVNVAFLAINRQCKTCHGDGILDNYDDEHSVPGYNTSFVTPFADFKVNSTVGNGRKWGGCAACHDAGTEVVNGISYSIFSNHDNHHYALGIVRGAQPGMMGTQCNYCHVAQGSRAEPMPDISLEGNANPLRIWLNESYPSYTSMFGWDTSMRHIELRNATIYNSGDTVNGTGCQKCHSVRDLHNIEAAAPGLTTEETLAQELTGYGHIGNNTDCNGCHAGWAASMDNPFAAETSIGLDSLIPGRLTAGVATDVTLTGSGFVQAGYDTTVLVDDQVLTPASLTDSQIVVTVPALSVGVHSVQVEKGSVTSALTSVVALSPGTIASAKLADGVLTVDGVGLGAGQTMVAITKADGSIVPSDSITSSTDTQIVAAASLAAVGDTVQVVTPKGLAEATIEAGTAGPGITSAKLANGVLTIKGSGFGTAANKNPQKNVYVQSGKRTYTADSILSWTDNTIEAKVNIKNWKVGQTVTVKIRGGQYQATITG